MSTTISWLGVCECVRMLREAAAEGMVGGGGAAGGTEGGDGEKEMGEHVKKAHVIFSLSL